MSYGNVYIQEDISKLKRQGRDKRQIIKEIAFRIRARYPDISESEARRLARVNYEEGPADWRTVRRKRNPGAAWHLKPRARGLAEMVLSAQSPGKRRYWEARQDENNEAWRASELLGVPNPIKGKKSNLLSLALLGGLIWWLVNAKRNYTKVV